jgi:hypothetical protein
MPKLMYGFLFEKGIREFVDSELESMEEIVTALNEAYGTEEIVFGEVNENDVDFHIYAGVEITNDIFEDGEGKFFSMDLDQIKSYDRMLLDFIDEWHELNEVAYCNSPRIFFTQDD